MGVSYIGWLQCVVFHRDRMTHHSRLMKMLYPPITLSLPLSVMAYRLQLAAGDHRATLDSFFQSCREQAPDLNLVPEDGLPVTTNSLTLSLYSPSLRRLLSSMPPSSPLSLSVPASSSSLSHLLHLLSKGLVRSQGRQELEQVQEVAKVLGITLGDCQVIFRKKGICQEQEKEQLIKEQDIEPHLDWKIKEEVAENSEELSCNPCGKQFKHIGHLKRHKLHHTKESLKSVDYNNPFKCSQCSDRFDTKKRLTKHILKEHGTCNECGKRYKFKGNLIRHKLTHYNDLTPPIESVETFSCSQCSDIFINSKKLEKHVLKDHGKISIVAKCEDASESGIRFKCTDCDKTFAKEHKLLKHIQNYHQTLDKNQRKTNNSGNLTDKPLNTEQLYHCNNCDKSFRNKKQLCKHRFSIHSGVTIICPDCNKEFSRRDKLNAHRRNKH